MPSGLPLCREDQQIEMGGFAAISGQYTMDADVRLGSLADIGRQTSDVCSPLNGGHQNNRRFRLVPINDIAR